MQRMIVLFHHCMFYFLTFIFVLLLLMLAFSVQYKIILVIMSIFEVYLVLLERLLTSSLQKILVDYFR